MRRPKNNAGFTVFDTTSAYEPNETAAPVSPAPGRLMDHRPDALQILIQNDFLVDARRAIYSTGKNCGLYLMEMVESIRVR